MKKRPLEEMARRVRELTGRRAPLWGQALHQLEARSAPREKDAAARAAGAPREQGDEAASVPLPPRAGESVVRAFDGAMPEQRRGLREGWGGRGGRCSGR
jgi:Tfp pilus assembly protein FimV